MSMSWTLSGPTNNLMDKVWLLKSYSEDAYAIRRLNLKTTQFEGLFETSKLEALTVVLLRSPVVITPPASPPATKFSAFTSFKRASILDSSYEADVRDGCEFINVSQAVRLSSGWT